MDGAANPLNFQIPRGEIRVSSLLLAGKGQSTFENLLTLIHCSERKNERSRIIVVTSTFLATPPCLSRCATAAPSTAPPPTRTLTLTRTPFYVASCFPIPKTARRTVTTSLSVEMPRGQVSSHHLLPRPARQSSNRGELPIPKTARRTVTTSLSVEMPRGQVSSHHLLPRPARQSSNRGERSLLYSRVVPGGERCTVLRGYLQRKGHTWPGSDEKAFVRDAHGHLRPGVGEVRHGNMNYYYLMLPSC